MSKPLQFVDLAAQRRALNGRIEQAIQRVVDDAKFIMGPEVAEFEQRLVDFCGAKHCVSCANGTDAMQLALMAKGVGPGDAVFVPSFTFTSTAEAVVLVGATPVFVDVLADTFNMDPDSLSAAIAATRDMNCSAIITVDLFGQPADYRRIEKIARDLGLFIIDDAAQSMGARLDNRKAGGFGDLTTTSFFPTKPLGCYGDGGAVLTDDDDVAERLRSIRVHGRGTDKYENPHIGMNSRLDTLQAAILIEKLTVFEAEFEARKAVAERYNAALAAVVRTPAVLSGASPVWANYTVQLDRRDAVSATLQAAGIPTMIYYPKPLHRRIAYRDFPQAPGGLPVSQDLAARVLSLPIHSYLAEADQDRIIETVLSAVKS